MGRKEAETQDSRCEASTVDVFVWILGIHSKSWAVPFFFFFLIAPWTLQSAFFFFFFFHISDFISSFKPHSEVGAIPILWVNKGRLPKVSTP